jgi:uncharacterized protein YchJ
MSGDYDFSLTTFSPSGKLVQIEYALNAMMAGTTTLGIKVCTHTLTRLRAHAHTFFSHDWQHVGSDRSCAGK